MFCFKSLCVRDKEFCTSFHDIVYLLEHFYWIKRSLLKVLLEEKYGRLL